MQGWALTSYCRARDALQAGWRPVCWSPQQMRPLPSTSLPPHQPSALLPPLTKPCAGALSLRRGSAQGEHAAVRAQHHSHAGGPSQRPLAAGQLRRASRDCAAGEPGRVHTHNGCCMCSVPSTATHCPTAALPAETHVKVHSFEQCAAHLITACSEGGHLSPTSLQVSMHVMQRSPDLWQQPLAFLPERFVAGSPEAEEVRAIGRCSSRAVLAFVRRTLLGPCTRRAAERGPTCPAQCFLRCLACGTDHAADAPCRWSPAPSFHLVPAAACAWACGSRS